MTPLLHLLGTLLICTALVRPLARARWVWRAPRTGIVLWQLLAVAWILSAIGALLALGLAPYDPDIPAALTRLVADLGTHGLPQHLGVLNILALGATACALVALLVAFGRQLWSVLRTRRRHHDLLALVARKDPAAPGALVLDHPLAMAYCLPGWRPAVVLSSGALQALSGTELAAVLAHERSHASERHDLVLLPFATLSRLLARVPLQRTAYEAVALLIEMRADDNACSHGPAGSLAAALRRFSAAGTSAPAGTLGVANQAVRARLERIDAARGPLPRPAGAAALLIGMALVATPMSVLLNSC